MKCRGAFEPVDSNPYLSDFYLDKEKYGFTMQVFLLNERFAQHQSVVWGRETIIQDRTIYEDPIFAKMLWEEGMMSDRDYQTYRSLFTNMTNFLHRPDVIIYLDVEVETALHRISKRGRECEKSIPSEYLQKLKKGYEDWIKNVGKVIPVLRLDWNTIPENYCSVVSDKLKEISCEHDRLMG